jgi:hypothetical protein
VKFDEDAMTPHRPDQEDHVARIDCQGRRVADVVGPILPWCRQTLGMGATPVIALHNLELLGDSSSALLKALDRLAVDFGVRITLSDRSGYTRAFLLAAGESSHPGIVEPRLASSNRE